MKAIELKKKYLDFFVSKGHKILPNVSLIPENDPTALFINSGMHPLVPYLLGEPHPLGKRLTSNQCCLRTQDIEKIGDNSHLTFFEMLGNWSLGDYWKKEVISLSWEFLTKELSLNEKRISTSCFAGDKDSPKDEESAQIWESLGIPKQRIYFLGAKENWWSVGKVGPCGSDTEMFYDTGKKSCGPNCQPGCSCGKYLEIWNDVFMEFNRQADGTLKRLKQRNIDTGMGVERTIAVFQGKEDIYQTEIFTGLINQIEEISGKKYNKENQKAIRIIVDHLRAATFAIADGVTPANVEAGYVVRRLVRRAIRYGKELGINKLFTFKIAEEVIKQSGGEYSHLKSNRDFILDQLQKEEEKFQTALEKGLKEFERKVAFDLIGKTKKISGETAFYLYETYGFPLELTIELAQEKKLKVDEKKFFQCQKEHQ
ncbi:MAG: alanine--tRNA ligase, partial [Candidatus Shapirobacteria bacterium]|nr:alanine--tRNA ligase [Candidatus Shapirobacteria bacterium]